MPFRPRFACAALLPIAFGDYLILECATRRRQPSLNEASPILRICLESNPSPNAEVRGMGPTRPYFASARSWPKQIKTTLMVPHWALVSLCLRSLHPAYGVPLAAAGVLNEWHLVRPRALSF